MLVDFLLEGVKVDPNHQTKTPIPNTKHQDVLGAPGETLRLLWMSFLDVLDGVGKSGADCYVSTQSVTSSDKMVCSFVRFAGVGGEVCPYLRWAMWATSGHKTLENADTRCSRTGPAPPVFLERLS